MGSKDKSLAALEGRATGTVVYRNLNLVDGLLDEVQGRMSVVVEGDRIAHVLNEIDAATAWGSEVMVIDCTGLYAAPGLIDAHVHLATLPDRPRAEAQMRRMLYGGITAVRDMAGDMRALADLARSSLINEIAAPDLFYAALMCGPDFYDDPRARMATLGAVPGAVPWAQAVAEDTDMTLAVAMARGSWATGIKLYACLCGNTVRRAIAEARRQGIPVWTHLKVYPAIPMDAVGATTVSHACMLAEQVLDPSIPDYFSPRRHQLNHAGLSLADPQTHEYISALATAGTIVDATLFVEQWVERSKPAHHRLTRPGVPEVTRVETAGRITRALHEAGVRIAAGTDLPSEPDDPYPSLQTELELLVRYAGFTPAEALRSATNINAHALGKQALMGTLEPGKLANIVLVDSDPLADIAALRHVHTTIKRGHRFARADYRHVASAMSDTDD